MGQPVHAQRKTTATQNYRLQHQKNKIEPSLCMTETLRFRRKSFIFLSIETDLEQKFQTECHERRRLYQQFRVGITGDNFLHETESYIHSRTKVLQK